MYNEKIINTLTGEEIIRPYTKEEIAEVEAAIKKAQIKREALLAHEESRKSALAKLAALGLTEEEIAAL